MRNGFIYTITNWILEKLKYLNLVEFFKLVAQKIYKKDKLLASRAGVDLFIILKWALVFIFWFYQVESEIANLLLLYLILSNIYTYFYYHVWTKDLKRGHFSLKRIKRRFLNLVLAISFNIISFAYLFALPFSDNFHWAGKTSTTIDAIFFSIANSLTVDYANVQALTQTGQQLILFETFTTFIFFTIILSSSVPQIKNE